MAELTVYLNKTTRVQFCEWLTNYSEKLNSANVEYPYHGGGVYKIDYPHIVFQVKELSFSARIKQRPLSDGEPPVGIDQWKIIDPEVGATYIFWEWVSENIIKMSWVEVEERLRMTVAYDSSLWILPPVFQLLWSLKTDFPSTSDAILNHIKEKADWWNLNPPMPDNNAAMAYIIAMQAREEIKKKEADFQTVKVRAEKPEKPKQKGRYRLTKDDIKRRKKIVKDAKRIFKESNPKKTWKQIAYELGIPERTLRDWRHNPEY